jgi:hypothetical protein
MGTITRSLMRWLQFLQLIAATTPDQTMISWTRRAVMPVWFLQSTFKSALGISAHNSSNNSIWSEVPAAEESIGVALQLCHRNSSSSNADAGSRDNNNNGRRVVAAPNTEGGQDSHGDALWFRLCDETVEALKRYKPYDGPRNAQQDDEQPTNKNSKGKNSESTTTTWQEVMHTCLLGFLRTIMDGMLANVRMEKVLRTIVQNHHTKHFWPF